jgi:hypothetical protein
MATTPVKEKVWICRHAVTNTNVYATDTKKVWYELKCSMVAAGGVVQQSSNGVAYGASDYWTGYTAIPTSGTNYGWVLIRFSSMGPAIFEVLLSARYSSGTAFYEQIKISFVGFSGGNLTTVPTAADALTVYTNSGSNSGLSGTSNTYKVITHAQWTAGNDAFRFFIVVNGKVLSIVCFEKFKCTSSSVPVTDQWICWYYFGTGSAVTEVITQAHFYSTSANAFRYSTAGALSLACYLSGESNGVGLLSDQIAPNPLDSNSWPLFPVGVFTSANASYGYGRDGQFYDLRWGSQYKVNGTTYPVDGTKQWCQFGCLVFPWDGASPEIS